MDFELDPSACWYHGAVQRGCRGYGSIRRAARASPIVVAVACAAERPPPSAPVPHVELPRWEGLREASGWPLATAPFTAHGHSAGEFVASVRVAPAYLDLYRRLVPGMRWPVGMSVAVFHELRGAGGAGSVFAMTKLASGEWEYVVAHHDGSLDARGALTLCARCHSEAPADSLFGVSPRTAESAPLEPRSSDTPLAR